jgi:hypothetical protein
VTINFVSAQENRTTVAAGNKLEYWTPTHAMIPWGQKQGSKRPSWVIQPRSLPLRAFVIRATPQPGKRLVK